MAKDKVIKIYKREAFLTLRSNIPKDVREELRQDYTFRFYEEQACKKCEYFEDRHSDVCDNCAAYQGGTQLVKDLTIKEKKYMSFPVGDRINLEKKLRRHGLGNFKIINKHSKDTELKKKVKFTGKLKDHQPDAVKAIIKKKRGVLSSPPRSGKTVMASAAICKIGHKTLILASQRDWLVGFYETFCGSKTQKPLTNAVGSGVTAAEIRKFKASGKKANVGFCRTYDEFMSHDICLATVQTFWSPKGQKLLKKLSSKFNVVVVDEIQTGAAPKYAGVLSNLNSKWLVGLSGTPDRKDGRFILMDKLLGPTLFKVEVARLRPTVQLTRTQYVNTNKKADWTRFVTSLECDPKRLKLIAQTAIKDVKNGHMVLIPLARVKAIKVLCQAINKMAGKTLAKPFYGGVKKEDRDKAIEQARKYKLKILVGQAKLLSTGINIPRASALYEVSPSSNIPNAEQRISRILTPWDDKPPPMLRYFLDDAPIRRNCMKNEWWNCVRPRFKPVINEKNNIVLTSYFSTKSDDRPFDL